jgi:hypothetical protein
LVKEKRKFYADLKNVNMFQGQNAPNKFQNITGVKEKDSAKSRIFFVLRFLTFFGSYILMKTVNLYDSTPMKMLPLKLL